MKSICSAPAAYCPLPTAYCLLPTAYCLLPLQSLVAWCPLPGHARHALHGGKITPLQDGWRAQGVQVKLDCDRLAAGRGNGPSTRHAQHPLNVVSGPGLLPLVSVG